MLRFLSSLSLACGLLFTNTSAIEAAKVSHSHVIGQGRWGGSVVYPDHYRIELKPTKELPSYKMDITVGWYKIVKQTDSKYHQALTLIKSGFKEKGDLERKKIIALLKSGVRYSYVIKDDVLRIAEIFKDSHPATRFSKHILLADFAMKVTYAGELWKDPRSDKGIILDNNSGTFKPKAKDLAKIATLLKRNLRIKITTKVHWDY